MLMSKHSINESYHEFLTNSCAGGYLFGLSWHGHPEIPAAHDTGPLNFIAVFTDSFDMHTVRLTISNFHQSHRDAVKLTVVTKKSWDRFLALRPILAKRIATLGWRSNANQEAVNRTGSKSGIEIGWMAQQLMFVSADLFKTPPETLRLQSLLKTAPTRSNIQHLSELISENWFDERSHSFDPNNIPDLDKIPIDFPKPVAIYLKLDQLILVTHDVQNTLTQVNPANLKPIMDSRSATGIQVCTPKQFQRAVQVQDLMAARLASYQLLWGRELLRELNFDQQRLIRNAAASATYWQVTALGQRMFTGVQSNENDQKLIHDMQNRLLNLRLQHDILGRLGLMPPGEPPIPMPGRTAPTIDRIRAIVAHFDWWSEFYLNQLNAA